CRWFATASSHQQPVGCARLAGDSAWKEREGEALAAGGWLAVWDERQTRWVRRMLGSRGASQGPHPGCMAAAQSRGWVEPLVCGKPSRWWLSRSTSETTDGGGFWWIPSVGILGVAVGTLVITGNGRVR
ncbi:MAG: hypothetical protein ACK56I_26050, partial [bacterium]